MSDLEPNELGDQASEVQATGDDAAIQPIGATGAENAEENALPTEDQPAPSQQDGAGDDSGQTGDASNPPQGGSGDDSGQTGGDVSNPPQGGSGDASGKVAILAADAAARDLGGTDSGWSLTLEDSSFRQLLVCSPSQSIQFVEPASTDSKSGRFSGVLDPADDLTDWMSQKMLINSLLITADASPINQPAAAKVISVQLGVQLNADTSSQTGEGLTFTTNLETIKQQFGSDIKVDGTEPALGELVAALVFTEGQTNIPGVKSVSDLCRVANISLPTWAITGLGLLNVEVIPPKASTYPRSAVWISGLPATENSDSTQVHCKSLLRLALRPVTGTAINAVQNLLGPILPKINLDGVSMVYRQACTQQLEGETKPEAEILITMNKAQSSAGGSQLTVHTAVSFGSNGTKVFFTFDEKASISGIVNWIFAQVTEKNGTHINNPDLDELLKLFGSFGGKSSKQDFGLKQVILMMNETKVDKVMLSCLGTTSMGAAGDKLVPFNLDFTWEAATGKLHCEGGCLTREYFATENPAVPLTLRSSYEESTYFDRLSKVQDKLQYSLQLRSFLPAGDSSPISSWPFPKGIPDELKDVKVTLDVENKSPTLKMTAILSKPKDAHGVFSHISNLNLALELAPSSDTEHPPKFTLDGALELNNEGDIQKSTLPMDIILQKGGKSEFKLTGKDLRASLMASFLEPGHERDALQSMLGSILVRSLDVSYEFQKSGGKDEPKSSFQMAATVAIGKLNFDARFSRPSGQPWHFDATLKPAEGQLKDVRLQELIENLGSKELVDIIPDFVSQTVIPLSGLEAKLSMSKKEGESVVFHFHAKLGELHFDFAQIKKHPDAISKNQPGNNSAPGSVIRLLRVAIGKLPSVPSIPLVQSFDQPFEQLHFVWLNQDLSTADVASLAESFDDPSAPLKFQTAEKGKGKKKQKQGDDAATPDSAAQAGLHFIVLSKEGGELKAVLDHRFGSGKLRNAKKPVGPGGAKKGVTKRNDPVLKTQRLKARRAKKQNVSGAKTGTKVFVQQASSDSSVIRFRTTTVGAASQADNTIVAADGGDDDAADPGAGADKEPSELVPLNKKIGPLTIVALGLKYSKHKLTVILDATVKLGPLEFMLDGFAVELDLEHANLHDLSSIKVHARIAGLGLEFKSGKLVIAGFFERINSPTEVGFAGGLNISISPYSFMAAGAYLEEAAGYKTVFGFLMATGPLMDFGWAEVRGIMGGFGYNSSMRLPSISEVPEFPLLSHSLPGGSDPLVQLHALTRTHGSSAWITPRNGSIWIAAGLIIKAVKLLDVQAVITFEISDSMKIGLIGEAVATVPPGKSPHDDGVFLAIDLDVSASLDLGRGILQVEAQLSPASFILSRDCHLTGGFALCAWFGDTSGHKGDWVFSVGGYHPAYNRPSHYPNPPRLGISWQFDSHISIKGESYFAITPTCCMGGGKLSATCDLGLVSAYFDAHADMLMMYRPFHYMLDAGVSMGVKFELTICWVHIRFSFDIGASVHIEGPPMQGHAHVDLALVSFTVHFGSTASAPPPLNANEFWKLLLQTSTSDKTPGPVDSHIIALSDGLLPTSEPSTEKEFIGLVRPGSLVLQVHSRAPLSAARLDSVPNQSIQGNNPIYSKPMQLTQPYASDMTVKIVREDQGKDEAFPNFKITTIPGTVPAALFGPYDHSLDSIGKNQETLRSNRPSLLPHVTGVEIQHPDPELSHEKIPVFSEKKLADSEEVEGHMHGSEIPVIPSMHHAARHDVLAYWGKGFTTAKVDPQAALRSFASILKEGQEEVGSRYELLETQPARKAFKQFDLLYSGGHPWITTGA